MTVDEIRRAYLEFFEARDHAVLPSDSLVPENDPSLLFTGAGMNQFKDYFLGLRKDLRRATTSQKCLRTGDLENVGVTSFHHTFFEMLGNFSFADYFKREAIAWAWEFLVDVLGLPADRLSVTVYEEDDEAFGIWREEIGLPEGRITRLGAKSNFWPSNAPADGPNGPCGPCSEIFFDTGAPKCDDPGCNEDCDCGKYVEVWNLVFTQFDRRDGGELVPLPGANVDTGMGFERVVAVVKGTSSAYETELFRPIIDVVSELSGVAYDRADPAHRRLRRIADHARAAVFCICDGVRPGNEGRGYVLRRILRRAIRDGILLGLEETFLHRLVPPVLDIMGDAYPEIREGRQNVEILVRNEEERFRATYEQGMARLEKAVAKLAEEGETVLPGRVAFEMYDTYGFPLDLAKVILEERGLDVDEAGFEVEMERRRAESRDASQMGADIFSRGPLAEVSREHGDTEFDGYGEDVVEGRTIALLADDEILEEAAAGREVVLVTDRSPFYAEAGGQVGDAGRIEALDGSFAMEVTRTLKTEGLHLHQGRIESGTARAGLEVRLSVDSARRRATERNHTATHLLHRALRSRLGESVEQSGSLVAPDRLTFDFTHHEGLGEDDLREVEREVNRVIREDRAVVTAIRDLEEARASGAMALFGEKYGDRVRVVSVGDYSTELCGGTHVGRTGEIGTFRIVRERSVAAGIRRIEALTGEGAVERSLTDRRALGDAAKLLRVKEDELPTRIGELLAELKERRKAATRPAAATPAVDPASLLEAAEEHGGVRIVAASVPGAGVPQLRALCDGIRARTEASAICVLDPEGKAVQVVVAGGTAALEAGFDSGRAIRAVTGVLGGGGGGKPAMAQGKGRDASRVEEALEVFRAEARKLLGDG
jgi:alanyl-tRNA synthetase